VVSGWSTFLFFFFFARDLSINNHLSNSPFSSLSSSYLACRIIRQFVVSIVSMTSTSSSSSDVTPLFPNTVFAASLLRFEKQQVVASPSLAISKLSRWLGLYELKSWFVYKSTFIEFVGTGLMTYVSCASVMASVEQGFWSPRLALALIQSNTLLLLPFLFSFSFTHPPTLFLLPVLL
jgi:hypothetical protein